MRETDVDTAREAQPLDRSVTNSEQTCPLPSNMPVNTNQRRFARMSRHRTRSMGSAKESKTNAERLSRKIKNGKTEVSVSATLTSNPSDDQLKLAKAFAENG